MTEKELKNLLEISGIPFRYNHWNSKQPLPFGVYYFPSTDNLAADGIVYNSVQNCIVELYTKDKSPQTEKALENVLTGAEIYFEKTEVYINAEKMYQISYEMRF